MRIPLCLCLLLASFLLQAATDFDRDQIQQRIAPVGQVTIQGADAAASPAAAPKQETAKPRGQEIYDQYCHVCHESGVAGAPKFRDKADWEPRLKAKDLSGLIAIVNKGLNAMPPKGTCSDCTDDDIKAAILYMVPPK